MTETELIDPIHYPGYLGNIKAFIEHAREGYAHQSGILADPSTPGRQRVTARVLAQMHARDIKSGELKHREVLRRQATEARGESLCTRSV